MENRLTFQLSHFEQHETTITAELKDRSAMFLPGVYGCSLKGHCRRSLSLEGATRLKVIATDGYMVEFDIQRVLNDDQMLLIREGDMLRLIAGNYDGGYWVKLVNRLVVE